MKSFLSTALSVVAGCAIASAAVAAESPTAQVSDLIKLAEQNPQDAELRVRIGSLLNQMGAEEEAQVYLDQARQIDPSLGDLSDAGATYDDVDFSSVRGASQGQDVWVCTMPFTNDYGLDEGFYGYSVATRSANQGDEILSWFQEPNNLHPVIGQNLYQWHDGLFRQVGQSWLKHGFCALQSGGCGSCQPAGGGCPPLLGPGCSDPYSASLNGNQNRLGPKHEVNPTTGIFPGVHARPSGTNFNRGRLLVPQADAIPSDQGAEYWVESQYIHAEDSHTSSDNSINNVSHAEVSMSNNTQRSLSNPPDFLTWSGNFPQEPAIMAWKRVDPSVEVVQFEADGYIWAGGSATDQGDGTWLYQYNVFNLDSNAGVDEVMVNFGGGVNVSASDFHHPLWHSGSTYSNEEWLQDQVSGGFAFTVANDNVNNNRVRWGTTYSYTFVADTEPTDGTVTLNVPGVGQYDVALPVPSSGCTGDLNGDGIVDANDLAGVISFWGSDRGDLTGDGATDASDLATLVAGWGPCP
jgi:hypothetical protein